MVGNPCTQERYGNRHAHDIVGSPGQLRPIKSGRVDFASQRRLELALNAFESHKRLRLVHQSSPATRRIGPAHISRHRLSPWWKKRSAFCLPSVTTQASAPRTSGLPVEACNFDPHKKDKTCRSQNRFCVIPFPVSDCFEGVGAAPFDGWKLQKSPWPPQVPGNEFLTNLRPEKRPRQHLPAWLIF